MTSSAHFSRSTETTILQGLPVSCQSWRIRRYDPFGPVGSLRCGRPRHPSIHLHTSSGISVILNCFRSYFYIQSNSIRPLCYHQIPSRSTGFRIGFNFVYTIHCRRTRPFATPLRRHPDIRHLLTFQGWFIPGESNGVRWCRRWLDALRLSPAQLWKKS